MMESLNNPLLFLLGLVMNNIMMEHTFVLLNMKMQS